MNQLRSDYLRVPSFKSPEFWSSARIGHVRALAVTGHGSDRWNERPEGTRPLDRLDFSGIPRHRAGNALTPGWERVDAETTLARGRVPMATPLYFGDMSYGSLSGIPNVALARAADATGALAGTGEGGLHPDVGRCERITVQWASARFGVTPAVLNAGLAVVIKVGQGAKPGVGGHLPASKVTDVIRRNRRIPRGVDAISPAPHHDIYSIEDLGQRIAALKHLTGKPVIVKVAATNYAPFVACGIARMGGDGVILDGAGAGTGASPTVMKDHVGIPVEYAVAGVDRMLRREGLRDGFSVVAAGTVSSPLDAARLMALGADCASIGTASLVGMGCVMVHKCHQGSCPALLTTPAEDDPRRSLDLDWITRLQINLVRGWTEELQAIARALGLRRVADLVGRRDLLAARGSLAPASAKLFGVPARDGGMAGWRDGGIAGDVWSPRHVQWVREVAGTAGKHAGEAHVGSMGSTAPPFAEPATRPLDHLRVDGAQVTRPAIDSYREPIGTHARLAHGMRLAAPLALMLPAGRPDLAVPVAGAAHALGLLAVTSVDAKWPHEVEAYGARVVRAVDALPGVSNGNGANGHGHAPPLRVLRVPSSERALASLPRDARTVDAILVDEDLGVPGDDASLPLEVFVARADRALGPDAPDLVASSSTLRGAGDVVKLVALGAAAVALPGVLAHALHGVTDARAAREHVECLALGLQREVKLLMGAAGVSALPTLRGNRELLRAIDLDDDTCHALGVKSAGWG